MTDKSLLQISELDAHIVDLSAMITALPDNAYALELWASLRTGSLHCKIAVEAEHSLHCVSTTWEEVFKKMTQKLVEYEDE